MDMEDRIRQLELQVTDLRIAASGANESRGHLADTVEGLTKTVQELRDVMNKGRGAFWAANVIAAVLGGAAGIFANKFLGG